MGASNVNASQTFLLLIAPPLLLIIRELLLKRVNEKEGAFVYEDYQIIV